MTLDYVGVILTDMARKRAGYVDPTFHFAATLSHKREGFS